MQQTCQNELLLNKLYKLVLTIDTVKLNVYIQIVPLEGNLRAFFCLALSFLWYLNLSLYLLYLFRLFRHFVSLLTRTQLNVKHLTSTSAMRKQIVPTQSFLVHITVLVCMDILGMVFQVNLFLLRWCSCILISSLTCKSKLG